jgi:hypothetical protein
VKLTTHLGIVPKLKMVELLRCLLSYVNLHDLMHNYLRPRIILLFLLSVQSFVLRGYVSFEQTS